MIGPKENPFSCQRGIMDGNAIKRREGNGQPIRGEEEALKGKDLGSFLRDRGRFEQLP